MNSLFRIGTSLVRQHTLKLCTARYCAAVGSKEHLDKIVKDNKIVVFMKGTPEEPRCGFSRAVTIVLKMHGVDTYDAHNVLEDEALRQGIKDYSDWPTIPQVYIDGEFIGGCDLLIEMHQNGDLIKELEKAGIKSKLLEELEKPSDEK